MQKLCYIKQKKEVYKERPRERESERVNVVCTRHFHNSAQSNPKYIDGRDKERIEEIVLVCVCGAFLSKRRTTEREQEVVCMCVLLLHTFASLFVRNVRITVGRTTKNDASSVLNTSSIV